MMMANWQYIWVMVPVIGVVWITGQLFMMKGLHSKIGPEVKLDVPSEPMETGTPVDITTVGSAWIPEKRADKKGGPKPYER